jgi:GTP-binding protein
MHIGYQRYLENQLRAAFGFVGTPVRFILRKRGSEEQEERQRRRARNTEAA